MISTAAFWIGFLAGDVCATAALLFILALLHAGGRSDDTEIGPNPHDSRRGPVRWRGPVVRTAHGAAPPLSPDGYGND